MSNKQTDENPQKNKKRIAVELDKLIAAIAPNDVVLKFLKAPGRTKE